MSDPPKYPSKQWMDLWQAYLEKKEELEMAQDRITELETALRDLLTPQTPASFAGAMRRARAVLEAKKDE